MPVSSPGSNFYGGDRPGDNLFANSTIAIDIRTGELEWYFQNIHHELWDYNLPPSPGLLEIERDGERIPALAQVGKSAFMFILNRVTGEPIHGVEERPVPAGDVPGEEYSPTQPIPLKPPPVARVSIGPDDVVTVDDTTPARPAASCGTPSATTTRAPIRPCDSSRRAPRLRSCSPAPAAASTGTAPPTIRSSV